MARPPPPTATSEPPSPTLRHRCHFCLPNTPNLNHLLLCLLILLQLISVNADGRIAMSDEKRLIKYLLDNYERVGIVGRPVYNTSETVRVNYGLALIQILDLDEKNQVLTTNVWSRYGWRDILLLWDPKDYGGVTQVRVPASEIWTPDIVLYNYADARLNEQREALAVVSNTGQVLWIPMSIFKSTCSIDIGNFPFDDQTCHMKFGSWTYDGFKLNLEFYADQQEVDVTDYITSNEWDLLEHPAIRNVKRYPCCVEPYIDLTFTVRLKRIGAFYSYVLILPCVLLSFLTLVVFWLPPESSAKMVIGMNIFVAFFLLLRILAASTPPASSSIPLLGAYFCLNMFLITMSTFLAVVVINLYFRQDKKNKVPQWLKTLFIHILARVFFMHGDFPPSKSPPTSESHTLITHIHGRRKISRGKRKIKSPVLQYNKWEPPPPATTMILHESPIMGHRVKTPENSPLHTAAIESEVREIRRALRSLMAKIQAREANATIVRDWRIVALVLDRLFFFIYVVTIITALLTMFPRS